MVNHILNFKMKQQQNFKDIISEIYKISENMNYSDPNNKIITKNPYFTICKSKRQKQNRCSLRFPFDYVLYKKMGLKRYLQLIGTQFNLQCLIEHKRIIKNFRMNINFQYIEIQQEAYLCSLADLDYYMFPYIKKLEVFQQIIEALHELKSKNICHCAICPQTIMIKENRMKSIQVKLNYFQTAKQKSGKKIVSVLRNSIFSKYYAPQVLNQHKYLIQSDLWSAGRLFFDMLFCGYGDTNISKESLEIQYPDNLPDWLKNFFEKMLAFSPGQRFCSSEILSFIKKAKLCQQATEKFYIEDIRLKKQRQRKNE